MDISDANRFVFVFGFGVGLEFRLLPASTLDACTALACSLLNAKEKESYIIKIVIICTDGNPNN